MNITCVYILKTILLKKKKSKEQNDIYCINFIVNNLKQKNIYMLLELPTYKDMNCKDSLTS